MNRHKSGVVVIATGMIVFVVAVPVLDVVIGGSTYGFQLAIALAGILCSFGVAWFVDHHKLRAAILVIGIPAGLLCTVGYLQDYARSDGFRCLVSDPRDMFLVAKTFVPIMLLVIGSSVAGWLLAVRMKSPN